MKYIALLYPFFLAGCLSIKDYSRLYFTQNKTYHGVESFYALNERLNKEKKLQEMLYGKNIAGKIYQCTLLRNQFYVAALKGGSSQSVKEILAAAKILEQAYQENDENFLQACDKILAKPLGREFVLAQKEFLIRIK